MSWYLFNRFTGTTSEKLVGFENGLFPIFTQIIQRDVTGMQMKICQFKFQTFFFRGKKSQLLLVFPHRNKPKLMPQEKTYAILSDQEGTENLFLF